MQKGSSGEKIKKLPPFDYCDNRPIDDEGRLYCSLCFPDEDSYYFMKIKEKTRNSEKNQENDEFFGQNR